MPNIYELLVFLQYFLSSFKNKTKSPLFRANLNIQLIFIGELIQFMQNMDNFHPDFEYSIWKCYSLSWQDEKFKFKTFKAMAWTILILEQFVNLNSAV